MRFTLVCGAAAALLFSTLAYPCGSELSGLVYGNKVLGIELSSNEFGMGDRKEIGVDDDGMLAMGFVASYCNQSLELVKVKFSDSQKDCMNKSQEAEHLEYGDRVSNYAYYGDEDFIDGKPPKGLAIIKKACNIDAQKLFAAEVEKVSTQPVACGDKVKGIVNKAAKRMHEYQKEEAHALGILDSLPDGERITGAKKAEALESLEHKREVLDQFAKMVNQGSLTRKDFDPWVRRFMSITKDEAFRVVHSMDELNTDKAEPRDMMRILAQINATLPGVERTRCGMLMSDKAIEKLSAGEWREVPGAPGSNSEVGK